MAIKGGFIRGSDGFKVWMGLASLVIVLDQLSKLITLNTLTHESSRVINSFINWVLVFNPGAAFSLLAQSGGWQKWLFTGIGSLAAIFIIWMLKRHAHQAMFCFSLSMILGGALGNVIDRIAYGAVVDFIDVFYKDYHWPAFNLADSAIFLGTFLLIADEIRRVVRHR